MAGLKFSAVLIGVLREGKVWFHALKSYKLINRISLPDDYIYQGFESKKVDIILDRR